MPELKRDDGVEIHWEERGQGPLVVICPHCLGIPEVFGPLIGELSGDHRVIRYDARGTGESTREGPYDIDTDAEDLAAVIEASGGPAVVFGIGDACHRAVRVATRRPDLVSAVIAVAGAPVSMEVFKESDAMVASPTVLKALLEHVETDYRAALRSLVTAGNPQMSEDERRERVRRQADYRPREVALATLRAWMAADSTQLGLETGDRLWILYPPQGPGGPWFPPAREFVTRVREVLPEAHVEEIGETEEGIVSRPDLTAGIVRRITAPLRAPAG